MPIRPLTGFGSEAVEGGADEVVFQWYHRGLDAFEHPLLGGAEFEARFRERVLEVATAAGSKAAAGRLEALVTEAAAFRGELAERLRKGRDRLLELNSFHREAAEAVLARVRAADADPLPRELLLQLLDHFGVGVREHEDGDLFLDPVFIEKRLLSFIKLDPFSMFRHDKLKEFLSVFKGRALVNPNGVNIVRESVPDRPGDHVRFLVNLGRRFHLLDAAGYHLPKS